MIQAQLVRIHTLGKKVLITWIPRALRTRVGDRITAGKDPQAWTVDVQYETVLDSMAIHHDWKVGGVL